MLHSGDSLNLEKPPLTKGGVFEGSSAAAAASYAQSNADAGQELSLLFDEASGNLTEAINGLTFTATGSPTYSVVPPSGGLFLGWGTGITFAANTNFANLDALVCSPGNNNFTIEFGYKTTNGGSQAVFRVLDASDNNTMWCEVRPGVPGIQLFLTEAGIGNSNCIWTVGGITLDDGLEHKVRITCNISGNAECFVDGVSQGVVDISSHTAWDVPTKKIYVGTFEDLSEDFLGTLYFLRWTRGLTANLGGPGGG